MNSFQRTLRRRQLDSQFALLGEFRAVPVPRGGWLRSVREALGISLDQLARRLGLASASTVHDLERGEVRGSITINRMRAAADALGCDLVVTLVPRQPLERTVREQALRKASARLGRVSHTMAMEAQGIGSDEASELLQRTADEILSRGGGQLWD